MRHLTFCSLLALVFSIHTVHAQVNWEEIRIASTTGYRIDDIFFIDDSTGWAVNGGGQIFHTTDQGENWILQHQDSTYFRSVGFFDQNHGFVGSLDGRILETKDGGVTWNDISTQLPTTVPGVCGMSLPTSSTAYFTGVYWGDPYLLKTTDGGNTWQHTDMQSSFSLPGSSRNSLVDLHFFDANTGVLCGGTGPYGEGVIFRTEDGGTNWTEVYTTDTLCQNDCRIWKLFFLTDEIGYATVEDFMGLPYLLKTTDAGLSWTPMLITAPTPSDYNALQAVGFLNEDLGWAGGHHSGLFETTDGGVTWTVDSTGANLNRFRRLYSGLMFGSGLDIYRYRDANIVNTRKPSASVQRESSLRVFPNPSSSTMSITYNLDYVSYMKVALYSLQGRLVRLIDEQMRNKGPVSFTLDVSDIPPGSYVVSVYTNEGFEAHRIVVQ